VIDDVIREALRQLVSVTGRSYEELADIALSLQYDLRRERYSDELREEFGQRYASSVGNDIDQVMKQAEEERRERRADLRAKREREAARTRHFGGHRPPRLEARHHADPLRHHRLRGFRRASRQDQTDVRTEQRSKL
jgi:hypothetical protein